MLELAVTVGIASLLGSLHCVAMCGGLVTWSSAPTGGSEPAGSGRRAMIQAQVLYHGARWLGYLLLGVTAGWLGQSLDTALMRRGLSIGAASLSGGIIVLAALWRLRRRTSGRSLLPERRLLRARVGLITHLLAPLRSVLHRAFAWAGTRSAISRSLVVGFSSGLLPCGWLYTFVAFAVGTGSPGRGAIVLSAFWLGSVPALFGLSLLSRPALSRLGRFSPALSTTLVLGLGLTTLLGRHPFSDTRPLTLTPMTESADPRSLRAFIAAAEPSCHADAAPLSPTGELPSPERPPDPAWARQAPASHKP